MSNIDLCREKLNNTEIKLYEASPTLMFAITDEKVFVITSFHTFFLRHTHRNYLPRLKRIKCMIEANQIHTPTDLISELKLSVGEGVEMICTDLDRYIGINK